MKKIYVVLASLFFLTGSCSTEHQKGNLLIKGNVKDLKLGTLLLKRMIHDSLKSIDSIKVDGNEHFEFQTDIKEPQVMILALPEIKDGQILFFAEPNDTITIHTFLESFAINPQIKAGINQAKKVEYQKMMKKFNEKKMDLFKAKVEASQANNQAKLDSIQTKMQNLDKKDALYSLNFIFNNKELAIAPYTAMMTFYNNKKALDTIYKVLPEQQQKSIYGKEIKRILSKQ